MRDMYKLDVFKNLIEQFCDEKIRKEFLQRYPNFPNGINLNDGMGEIIDVYTLMENIMRELQLDEQHEAQIKSIIWSLPSEKDEKNNTLMTDLYELTMSDIYYNGLKKERTVRCDV